ncbi:MAG: hypothetical protein HY863_10925 [Chloroflexi bacterium]|nr:hypothetical protein [Chloroflexota bacterium]
MKKIGKAERKDIFCDSKYVGKTLKWVTSNGSIERIPLKPHESANALFLEGVSDSEVMHFGFNMLGFRTDVNKNDWKKNGIYEVYVDVYGKIYNETKYRKQSFVVLIKFERGKEIEILHSIAKDFYQG